VETGYPIALKFGTVTQKGGVSGTKFGQNTINNREVICDYSQK